MRVLQEAEYPKLRWPLDIEQIEQDGQAYLLLSDRSGVAQQAVLVPHSFGPIVGRFDGISSIASIVAEGAPFGLTREVVDQLARSLSDFYLLDDAKSRAREDLLRKQFLALPIREMAFADGVYPRESKAARTAIDTYIADAGFPPIALMPGASLVGLMCPHIDYRRGWRGYAAAHGMMRHAAGADVVILLGTSHQAGTRVLSLTTKDFQTPFGVFPTAGALVDSLAHDYGVDRALADEHLHEREHSLELQLPFLAHALGRAGDPAAVLPMLVPILIGSFAPYLKSPKGPLGSPDVSDFVVALSNLVAALERDGKRVVFHAGVDMAHVGTHFGDLRRVSDSGLHDIEVRDKIMLQCLMASDESALFRHIAEDLDRRRICGFPSLFVMLAVMRRLGYVLKGHLGSYEQAVEPVSDTIVTFSSGYWTRS